MTVADTTYGDLMAQLLPFPDAELVFKSGGREIGAAYHVTELIMASNNSVDCGGKLDAWQESVVQLLDGGKSDKGHMKVSKFVGILDKGQAAVSDFGKGQLLFEFAPGNGAITRSTAAVDRANSSRVEITLLPQKAVCKPAARGAEFPAEAETECCGGAPASGRCCAA